MIMQLQVNTEAILQIFLHRIIHRTQVDFVNQVCFVIRTRHDELCVCEVTELLKLAPATVSRHMSVLLNARLVQSRKNGRWVYYRLPDKKDSATVRAALAWVIKANENEPQISDDTKQIKQILKTDLAEICKRQCKK